MTDGVSTRTWHSPVGALIAEFIAEKQACGYGYVAERALLGRFRRAPGSGPLVLIRARGVKRLDDTAGFFKTADLDAVIAFEM